MKAMEKVVRELLCRLYPKADMCSLYVHETHGNLFMRKFFIESMENDLIRDAELNITLGPETYVMIMGDGEIRAGYEKLMKMGALIGVAPENKKSEKLASDSSYIVQFSADHQKYRIGSRKSLPVSKFYRESLPIQDFSVDMESILEKRQKKLLL